ncbi:hypothetical protein BP5796_12069 [Coleophoma crateriformis]|uniref:NACHT domain-containing protein n=1 Tax=Coleophoma crateriformis TaxID=565419 RepID=A0A3D8QBB9_9HELO|nr:hypothetical protein BP5796_12069 [Coleophoma crateriformis]
MDLSTTALYLLIFLISSALLYNQLVAKRIPTRLHPDQAPRSRSGMVLAAGFDLHPPAGGVDIVFVHGLGSNPDTTWHARKPKRTSGTIDEEYVCWITDFLPQDFTPEDLRYVRAFFYNYDSWWRKDALVIRLSQLGKQLLDSIHLEMRTTKEERTRKIIFVGHSYGGLVIKQALIQAKSVPIFHDIAEDTKAVFFLGTPHRGSKFSIWGKLIARALKPLGSNYSIIEGLSYDSQSLLDLHGSFIDAGFDDLRVTNFFEQRRARILKIWFASWGEFVVEEQSAIYHGRQVKLVGLPTDHSGLNKFGYRTDTYHRILSELRETINSIRLQSPSSAAQLQINTMDSACLNSLYFPEMTARQGEVQDAHRNSCSWIRTHEQYKNWEADLHGLLWIQGSPGSGKSTLMKKILQMSRNGEKSGHIHLAFFFHRRGTQLQKTPIGLYRTILFQLLKQVPSAGTEFQKAYEEKIKYSGEYGKNWEWREAELRRVLKSTLITATRTSDIKIFIDALDEAGEDSARSVVDYLHELHQQLLESAHHIRICFSCRYYPVIRTSGGFQIYVDKENAGDISIYVREELKKWISLNGSDFESDHLALLQENITSKASGVFLWVYLVLPNIAKQYNNGKGIEEVLQILDRVPPNLSDIYQHIITELVDPTDRDQTLHLMQWICLAQRPLSVTELRYALASDEISCHPFQGSAEESKGFIQSDLQLERMINGLSGGLAEVRTHTDGFHNSDRRTVQFIHQSVIDFMLKYGFTLFNYGSAGNAIGQSHDRLARACINYLMLGKVQNAAASLLSMAYHRRDSQKLENHPFLQYATTSWFLHAEKAESLNIPQNDIIQRFQWPNTLPFLHWIEIYKGLINREPLSYSERCPGREANLIHVAAASNLKSVVLELSKSDPCFE